MKNKTFRFTLILVIAMFAFATVSFSQSKETKTSDKTVKQEIQKKNDTQQLKKIQTSGKTIETKTNSNVKAGVANYKGINNNTKKVAVNKNEKEMKKTELNKEHHKKYYNKSIIKNQPKENANQKQKEKK